MALYLLHLRKVEAIYDDKLSKSLKAKMYMFDIPVPATDWLAVTTKFAMLRISLFKNEWCSCQ